MAALVGLDYPVSAWGQHGQAGINGWDHPQSALTKVIGQTEESAHLRRTCRPSINWRAQYLARMLFSLADSTRDQAELSN